MFVKEQCFEETSIGKYPRDWEVAVLGEVARVKGGKRLPKGEKLADYDTGFPYVRVVDFSKGTVDKSNLKYLLPETRKTIKNYTISSNDVYISIAGTIGLAGVIPPELDGANLTENAAKICDLQNIEKRFLAYLFDAEVMKKQIAGLMGKGTQPKLALFRIENLKFPCPSMEEQRAIVEVLGVVDSAIEYADRIIAKSERLKRGLMQQLLTRGIGHTETKQTPIGNIPSDWQIVNLESIAEISTGTTPATKRKDYYKGNVPFIKTTEIDNNLLSFTSSYISQEAADDYSLKKHPPGTILMAMYGQGKTRGKVALLRIAATTTQNAAAIEVDENKCQPMFLWYFLVSRYQELRNTGIHGHISHLNLSFVKKLKIPLPFPQEQQKIVQILSVIDNKLDIEKQEKIRLNQIKHGLMDLLLTGKVRIKVD